MLRRSATWCRSSTSMWWRAGATMQPGRSRCGALRRPAPTIPANESVSSRQCDANSESNDAATTAPPGHSQSAQLHLTAGLRRELDGRDVASRTAARAQLLCGSRRRRQTAVDLARQHVHDEDGDLLRGAKRPGNRMLHRRQALQVGDGRGCIRLSQFGIGPPRHDRREFTSIRPFSGGEGGENLLPLPRAETGLLVGRQVPADKYTEVGDGESDIGAAEKLRHVGLAEKAAGRVAIGTGGESHEIFSPLDLSIGRARLRQSKSGGSKHGGGETKTVHWPSPSPGDYMHRTA